MVLLSAVLGADTLRRSEPAAMPPRATRDDEPSTRLLKTRVRDVFRHVPKALNGDDEAIHQMRVAGRRLRVALPLLASRPRGKRVRRALRHLRWLVRAAGGSRDLDVSLALLQQRMLQIGGSDPEARQVRARLRAARTRTRRGMVEALLDLEIARLRRDLREVVARRGESLFGVLVRLRRDQEQHGAKLIAQLLALGDSYEPESLHRVRISCRRLRYTAEIADAVRGQDTGAPRMLRALQEQLGTIHDCWVAGRWLAERATAAEARGLAGLAERARALEAGFVEASRDHHRAFLETLPPERVRAALAALAGARSAA
jgi:CHAD domain-containing protein